MLPARPVCVFCLIGMFAPLLPPALGQGRTTVLENLTLIGANGRDIKDSNVAFQGGKITGVGPRASGGFLTRKIDATGRYATSGLIDAWSGIARNAPAPATNAFAHAADNYNAYDSFALQSAWSQGFTAAYIPARTNRGFAGYGAVVRLLPPGSGSDVVIEREAALHFILDAENDPTLRRLQTIRTLRDNLREARDYRDAKDDYQDDLKEYGEKLGEKAKKQAGSAPATASSSAPASADSKAKKKKKRTDSKPSEPGKPGEPNAAAEPKKDAGPKKPTEPQRDPQKEALVRLLNGELILRVEAHRPEDILAMIEVANEYGIAIAFEGATGAHLVSDHLKKADIPVVVGPPRSSMLFEDNSRRYEPGNLAGWLGHVGVRVYFGTGPFWTDALPPAAFSAQLAQAVAGGIAPEIPIRRAGRDAAAWLAVEKKLGGLTPGEPADFVVWSAHPLSGDARVEQVYIDGQRVYGAELGKESD